MGSIWRSSTMQRIQIIIQVDSAKDAIEQVGNVGCVQFIDLNPHVNNFQRNFVDEIKRCDELERKVRFVYEQICKEETRTKKPIMTGVKVIEHDEESFSENNTQSSLSRNLLTYSSGASSYSKNDDNIYELEQRMDVMEKEIKSMNENLTTMTRNINELVERKHVLEMTETFFGETRGDNQDFSYLSFATGVIPAEKIHAFERVLWRSLRGNIFLKNGLIDEPIVDPDTSLAQEKRVFLIFYQGEQCASKISKICDSFGAKLYEIPDNQKQREESLVKTKKKIEEINSISEKALELRVHFFSDVATKLEDWAFGVRKHKSVHVTLNYCNYDLGRKCLIAEGWCPTNKTEDILDALSIAHKKSGSTVPPVLSVVKTKEQPPTYFETGMFTGSFQTIVDAYGIARYREVNPGVFTIITFPFLFAVMFGDAGHALILFLVSIAMIYFEKKILNSKNVNDIFLMLFDGRYLILLMSLFSLYTGMLYNDVFAMPVNIFGSRWNHNVEGNNYTQSDTVYPFGIDPIWKTSSNELFFYNSLKMKMSVVLGVTQMTLGIIMSLFNHIYFKKKLNIFFDFIPQILFMLSFFGYLVFIIILKWMAEVPKQPFLINVLIDMVLKIGSLPAEEEMYSGQGIVQIILVLIALFSVFAMLIPKPVILYQRHKKYLLKKAEKEKLHTDDEKDHKVEVNPEEEEEDEEEEEFEMSEIVIHQSIHTIEFVLGCISNTASYLRLWALSLAHSQLSTVFFEQILLFTVKSGSWILVFLGFGLWGGASIAVLCMMEALSAFLHALRLHWVEFQNKFYYGDGYLFSPFSIVEVQKIAIAEILTRPQNSSA